MVTTWQIAKSVQSTILNPPLTMESDPLPFSVVDSHVHYWDPERLRYGWLRGLPISELHTIEDYKKATTGISIDTIVFVQADCADDDAIREVNNQNFFLLRSTGRMGF
jgi:hypothetical protein